MTQENSKSTDVNVVRAAVNASARVVLTVLLTVALAIGAVAQSPTQKPAPDRNSTGQQTAPGPKTKGGTDQKRDSVEGDHKITPAEAQELFRTMNEILQFVSKDTGLPIKTEVKHKIASRDEVEAFLVQRMKEDPDAKRLDRSIMSLKKLGLVPRDFDLRPYLIGLLKEQIAGFYDTKTKTMFLLDWVSPEAQKPVLAHELTHALQDQNFKIEAWGNVNENKLGTYDEMVRDEARAARQAVLEGQATVVLLDYMLQPFGKDVKTAPAAVELMKRQMVEGGGTPMYNKAPLFLREALLFPYDAGMDFVRALLENDTKQAAFTGVFTKPPTDTRQIMQPETYVEAKRVPLPQLADVAAIVGKDYERIDEGGLGQFDLKVLSDQWRPPDPNSDASAADSSADGHAAAADGNDAAIPNTADSALVQAWRGGYYLSFQKKNSPKSPLMLAFVMHLASAESAREFESVYRAGLKQRYQSLTFKRGGEIETDEGPVMLRTEGEWFTATEGFDLEVSKKISDAMISSGKQSGGEQTLTPGMK